jgi:quinol monooxygenase YgiN
MANDVSWMLELTVQPGRTEDFKALMKEMVDAAHGREPDTLAYEWSLSADGTTCHLFERYKDSDAAMVHLGNFGEKFATRFFEILQPTSFVVYGSPSAQVKETLAPFNPEYMQSVGGFAR